jgi:hypothetical protein
MQTDDDCYVRVGRFLDALSLLPRQRLYWGDHGFLEPERDPRDKVFVTTEEWPTELYPPYSPGQGHVLSIDLVRELAAGENQVRTVTYVWRAFESISTLLYRSSAQGNQWQAV